MKGVEGVAIYIADCRICGPKPWGGGSYVEEWDVDVKDIAYALAHIKKPSVQPQDMKRFCAELCPFDKDDVIHMLHRGQPICGNPDAKLISECPTETTCPECRELSQYLDREKHKENCGLCRGGFIR